MPCNSDPGYDVTQRELDEVTAAACEMRKLLTKKQFAALSAKTKAWIERHEAWDQKRREEEARWKRQKELKKKAKSKLTEEEREALGVY